MSSRFAADPHRTMRTRAARASSAPVLPSSLSPVTEVTLGTSSVPLPRSEGSNDRRSRRSRGSSASPNTVRLLVPVLEYRDRYVVTLPLVVESPGTHSVPPSSRPPLQASRQRRHTAPSPASWMPEANVDEVLATLEPPPPDYDELFAPAAEASADPPRSASPLPPPGPPSYAAAVQAGAGRNGSRRAPARRGSTASTEENGTKRSMVKRFVRWLVVDDKRPTPSHQPWTGYASLFG